MNKKFITIALVLIGFMGFVSCEEEDDTTYVSPNYLVGSWNLVQVGTLNSQNALIYEDVENNNCAADNFTFNADFSFMSSDSSFDGTTCSEVDANGDYEIIPGNVVLNFADATTNTVSLRSLSDVTLELIDSDENGALTFYKYTRVQ